MREKVIRRRVPGTLALPERMHPVIRRVLAARLPEGADDSALDLQLSGLLPPQGLPDIELAAELLAGAIRAGRHVLVVGDFDADGATSTALAVRALRAMGATRVSYLVPNRFEFGYGLSPGIVELALESRPDLILTVDNGVTSLEGVRAAQAAGVQVVVTDHHLPGAQLPPADALVNPNLPGVGFASPALAGVGVIFYVMSVLRRVLRSTGWFDDRPCPNLATFLDLVALGTVADVVPLDRNNRILVAQGLERIRAGRAAPGLLALFAVAGRDPRHAVSSDLGFAIGPRLNAAGRLDDMSLGIDCLLADDPVTARRHAEALDSLNRDRREIEQSMQQQAQEQLARLGERLDSSSGELPAALVLHDTDWHQGVIGILAGRIKERWHRPTVVFATDEQGMCRGSGRSIPGLHLRDALEVVDARCPGLIERFGGHAMAAGLTLAPENLKPFREAFCAVVREQVAPADLVGEVLTDGPLAPEDINLPLAESLRGLSPWGQHFPEPCFDNLFEVRKITPMGQGRHQRLALAFPGQEALPVEGVLFNTRAEELPAARVWHVAYRLGVNHYRGLPRCQLVVEHVALPPDPLPALPESKTLGFRAV
ncbi:MAG: single-stranded-DNA-specific exonuclease RecJ [Halothiobacillaceae bacterium]